MKNYISLTVLLISALISLADCHPKATADLHCNTITLNKPFTARIGEQWCIPSSDWKITFGPMKEDSRCNVANVQCVWAGKYVMGATIDNGETIQQTFEAVTHWQDTIYSAPYTIYLNLVKPEVRPTTQPLDPSAYSFDIIVNK